MSTSLTFQTVLDLPFEEAVKKTTAALQEEGFGVLTEIDVKDTLKKKIDVDMPRYTILGACNPGFAHKALQAENKIGTMLPCNVVVQETADGQVEVAAVDPVASMTSIDNASLGEIAQQVQGMLKDVIEGL